MTEQDKIELSKRVAELYGVYEGAEHHYGLGRIIGTWLADDSARCFELMVEHNVAVEWWDFFVSANSKTIINEDYADHPSKLEATRIAILKCLVKMKESE